MRDKFSVIIPCYNNSEYLEYCINSVIEQTYENIEIIIADDYSTRFDEAYFRNFIKKNNRGNITNVCVYQNPENYGTVRNFNCAIKRASGKYIKLLAADDALFSPNVLSDVSDLLFKSNYDLLICDVMICDDKMTPVCKHISEFYEKLDSYTSKACFEKLCIRNNIMAGSVFFRASFFEKYGYFNEEYRLLEDWPTWLTVAKKGGAFHYEPLSAVKYRMAAGVLANNNPFYLADRKRVFTDIIYPARKEIGIVIFCLSYIMTWLSTCIWIRKLYYKMKKILKREKSNRA